MKETVDFSKLISDAVNGDEAANNEIYRLTHKTAYCTASLLLKNPDDIQDVLQNSYLKVFQKLPELKTPESLESWIKSIVENESKNYIKKEKRLARPALFLKNKVEKNSDEWKDPVPQEIMERDELRKSVCDILDKLSPEVRACIVLFHFEEKNLNEISELLGIPLGTVKSRLHNGRKQIEKEFNKLRKKDPTLYGIGAIPVLLSFLAYQAENITVPAAITESVIATTAASGAGASAAGTAAAATTVSTAAAATTGAASATAAGAIAVKVAAVAVAGTVAVGGGAAVINHIENKAVNESTTAYLSTVSSEEYTTVAQIAYETSTEISTAHSLTQTNTQTANEAAVPSSAPIQTSVLNTTITNTTITNATTANTTTKRETTTAKPTTTTTKPSTTVKPTTTAPPTTNPENNYGASGGVITEYSGEETDVSIPSEIGGNKVTAIGAGAFSGNTDIESVALPSTVTQIGQEAFADCRYLYDVSMPSSLELIGVGAFYGCSNLTSVDIPSGTQTISDEAFAQCTRLKTVTIPSSVTSISDDAFDGCDSLTIRCEENSAAHDYAVENGINYKII